MNDWKREGRSLALVLGVFALAYHLPVDAARFRGAVLESLALVRWYAREHVLLCLVPAFFIAGGIGVFVRQGSVMTWLGPRAPKPVAYAVASVSGAVLAVCSCTVLPLFAGIYRMGAGLGPATAFLYAGPAVNVLAIVLTARVLGMPLGIARAVGAVVFSVVIGLLMHLLFRREEDAKAAAALQTPLEAPARPLRQSALFFVVLAGILIFANWGRPEQAQGFWHAVYAAKWYLTGACALLLAAMLATWFAVPRLRVAAAAAVTVAAALAAPGHPALVFAVGAVALALLTATGGRETREWAGASWGFARQILPLLLLGVLAAGLLLGRPGHEGLIPAGWVAGAVGGNSLGANLFAAVAGAFMYFATLTEVPILEGLLGSGMGQGPALALLLAGPALSLPNMLVIRSVLGTRKTVIYVLLVVVMATFSGLIYGALSA